MESKTKEEDDESSDDLIKLSKLSEERILHILQNKFSNGNIYSYIGSILLAFNPYQILNIYDKDMVKKYEGQPIGDLPPHLFAISSACYSRMCRDQQDQVVLISGESGAGKTESTKLIMQYLAAINRNGNNDITDQILEGNPLLESFGNAKTIRNNNSSRFGKYIELYFQRGVLKGAQTSQYLLEKSRIVKQSNDERNYHIFYEILTAMSEEEKNNYGLQSASEYFYLNQGGSCVIPGRDDSENYQLLVRSLSVLGFSQDEKDTINRILASVLHLGNIYFKIKPNTDIIQLGSDAEIKWISHLLKLSSNWLKTSLTSRMMEAREEKLYTPLSIEQAQDARDAIAKALYSCLFAWLVERINQIVYRPAREKKTTMSLLDIFGFEEVELNSFEQLCINYANEMLHCFFNECVFQHEQLEYKKDRIEWKHIEFPDNEEVILLISCKPHGILHILDDESNFPQATDKSFLDKCHYRYQYNPLYEKPRMPSMEFSVYHYAGKVTYNVKTFLEKNKDTLRSDVIELLCESKDVTISRMFEEMKGKLFVRTLSKTTGRYMTKKPRAQTVAAQFNESLLSLIDTMKRCNPFFVRCIKPNINKTPMLFDQVVVLEQLRYSGVLQLIEIRKKGYPIRIKFPVFIDRYQCLLKETVKEYQMPNEVCSKILATVCPASELQYQVGASKVFLREQFEHELDKAAEKVKKDASVLIQRNIRAFLRRNQFQKIQKSTKMIQKLIRAWIVRTQFRKTKNGIVQAQALYRSYRQQKIYKQEQVKIQRERESKRREFLKKQAKQKMEREQQENEAATIANLDVPGELAGVYNKAQSWRSPHLDVYRVSGSVMPITWNPVLPSDIDAHAFSKYVGVFFKNNHRLGVTSKPIREPFLQLLEIDKQHSLSIFKLILRFMCDANMNDRKKKIISDYIIQKGLQNEPLRDEIYCQIANQTWLNQNISQVEMGWLLMANCLSCIPPSQSLNKYLLKYVSDVGFKEYKEICQHKALHCMKVKPHLSRIYPPCLLEWKAAQEKANMALRAKFPDDVVMMGHVESWTNGEVFAAHLLDQRNMFDNHSGWTVVLEEQDHCYELMGYDYVLDLISEIEIIPGFPVCKSYILVSSDPSAGPGNQRFDANTPHSPDRDRKMVYDGRLPEPVPLNASKEANVQNVRNGDMVFSTSNPLNKRRVEEFLPALTDNTILNSRYYSRKLQTHPNQANGLSSIEESGLDPLGNIILDQESKLNGRHIDGVTDISDSKLNSRYVQQQGKPETRANRLGSTSDNSTSAVSKWVDNLFEGALNDGNDSLKDPRYMENVIKGGGKVLAQPQVPVTPVLQAITNPANVNPILAPLNVPNTIVTAPFAGITNLDPNATQFAAAQMAAAQQQQAIVQAYLNQMVRTQRLVSVPVPAGTGTATVTRVTTSRHPAPSVIHTQQIHSNTKSQQQQQQQALLQVALQQQQINPVGQPYLVLVQPDGEAGKMQVAMATGQQQQQLQLQNGVKLMRQQSSATSTTQNHSVINKSQSFTIKPPAPTVQPKPAPPPVQPKPNRRSVFEAPSSPPVVSNGFSSNNQVTTESSEAMHKKAIPAGILLGSATENISINTAEYQNPIDLNINSPSESTGTSSLSSPSDSDLSRQLKASPLPYSQQILSSADPGTIRNHRAHSVHIGKVIWPPPAEPTKKKEVQVGKLDINENLAQDIKKIAHKNGGQNKWNKLQDDVTQTSSKQPPPPQSTRLVDKDAHRETLRVLENKFSGFSNTPTQTESLQNSQVKPVEPERKIVAEPIKQPVPVKISKEMATETVEERPNIDYSAFERIATKLHQTKRQIFLTYKDVPWTLRLRKEVFSPKEKLDYAAILDLVFCQVVHDIYSPSCIRITKEQRHKMQDLLESHHIYEGNSSFDIGEQVKRIIVDTAKEFPTYFCRLFPVACGHKYQKVIYLGVNHSGAYLVTREKIGGDQLKVVESFKFEDILEVVHRSANILQLTMQNKGIVLYTKWTQQIKTMIEEYQFQHEQGSKFAYAKKDYLVQKPTLLSFKQGSVIKLMDAGDRLDEGWLYGSFAGNVGFFPEECVRHMNHYDVNSFKQPLYAVTQKDYVYMQQKSIKPAVEVAVTNGHVENHSDVSQKNVKLIMLDFALQYFRESVERNRGVDPGTERDLMEMVMWTETSIQNSLLLLDRPDFNAFAIECFRALMMFMADWPSAQSLSEVDCAMKILKTCHKYPELREEVYCQLCRQTTFNKNKISLIRGWRFFSLFAAYNDCSERLRPYLTKYLENSAMESSPISAIADLCLKNLRKTFRYGGRKNVPLADEISSLAEGRMSKQHPFSYKGEMTPSGFVAIKSSTLVKDIIAEICGNLNIVDAVEIEEYTLFLSIITDKQKSPIHRLRVDEYLLDITADLQKKNKAYELLFQRTVWFFPIYVASNGLYIEHMFLQTVNDYMEGFLLILNNGTLPKDSPKLKEISVLGALLHQALGATSMPQAKDLKYIIPKPMLKSKDPSQQQWLNNIQGHLKKKTFSPYESKTQFINILSTWELFGSTFFKLKSIPPNIGECLLAVNKNGIQILNKIDHTLLMKYEFKEILSTRLYRENNKSYLDMKLGNLMAQKISRIETDQCSDISTLIGQYNHVINRHRKRQGNAVRIPLFN